MQRNESGQTGRGTGKTAAILAVCALAGAGGLMLLGGMLGARSAPASSGGWQTYKDAKLGFAVERPAGWAVRADSHSILMQSPDHSKTVLMEAFTASPGESAEAHLNNLTQEQAALFPQAQVSNTAAQPSKGDEVSATLSYQSANGPGQGRVLCFIAHGKGLLFVLAAPGGNFAADQPVLTRIVKSLRFTVPGSKAAPTKSAAQTLSALRGLHFVSWTDPREHGFHVDVPQGWKAEGGAFHLGPTDLRIAYDMTAPAKDMQVVVGDPRLPSTLVTPNPMLGAYEGQNGCMHYMEAAEFDHWYLNNFGRQGIDNLLIGADHPLPEVSRQRTLMAQRMFGSSAEVEVNVGLTEFSGLSKMTHKQITGIIIGTTQRMTSRGGMGAETTTWVPTTVILTCNDDANKARNEQIVMAVFARTQQSYREDPAWVSRLANEGAASGEQKRQEMVQTSQDSIRRSQQMSQQITQNSDASRNASMGAYWGHVSADNERQRGFVNYMGDRTDVTDGSGATVNVQSGSRHYYKNGQTGTVIGTDSAYSPGVDFTPLTER
ncbi:MAG: hypothetical protein ACRYFS_10105 [Janthinobacterium lividum]